LGRQRQRRRKRGNGEMIESWFDGEERVAKLREAARNWVGTPFFANGNCKGKGVSCQKLVAAIYRECGAPTAEVPDVAMAHSKFSRVSLVERFMEGVKDFVAIDVCWLRAGDLMGFRLGRVVHHLGICVPSPGYGERSVEFIHAMEHVGTVVSSLSDATWSSRLQRVWRPVGKKLIVDS
jgi:cell wall-associated NlpC family hydrolase